MGSKRAEREASAGAREVERKRAQNARARAYRARKRAVEQAAGVPVAVAEPVRQPPPPAAAVSASRLAGRSQVAARPGRQSEAEQAGVLNRNERRRQATAAARAAGLDSQGMARLRILDAHGETIASSVFDPLDPADLARACRLSGLPIELLARAAHDDGVLDWLAAGVRPETRTPSVSDPD